ncbi:MAG: hypothetical protein OEO77_13080, partial [Acidimicrobiia bacterium]|nr:hypothetical protein [Acidimicrobiia bacterium]
MQTQHDALPWPPGNPETLTRTAKQLGGLSESIRSSVDTWRPRTPTWTGRSADAHATELEGIRNEGASLSRQIEIAAGLVSRFAADLRAGMDEIRSLSVRIRSAEAYAADLRSAANGAHRLAENATWIEAASPVESQRIREDASRARQRADIATREAAALLERGIDSANEIVMALARRDRVVAGTIDGLLHNRLRLRPRDRTASGSVVAHDRSWATLRFQATADTIRSHVYALAEAVRRIESVPWQDRTWWESMALVDLTEKAELQRRFLSPDRQILEWDPDGDGRIVEVFGDLTTANHIAVV